MTRFQEVKITFEWNGLTLAGSFHLPPGPGPHPAVLMAQGSGPADRDSDGYFEPIRMAFLDGGVATFSFDKPGCGQSSGNWRHYALEGRAEQAVVALEVVRHHPAVDATRVGIWGHSQGGWLVQKLAGRLIPLAFAITSSAPTIDISEQIRYDSEQMLRAKGYSDVEVEDALAFGRMLEDAARDGADYDTVQRRLVQPAGTRSWFVDFPTLEDADDWRHLSLLITEPFDPMVALRQIACPFLAVYGGQDPLLPPWQGAEQSGRALVEAGNTDATIVVFPDGNHRLQRGAIDEFVDGYLPLLTNWVAHRSQLTG